MIDLKDFSNRIKKEFGRFTFYEEPHIYTYKDDNGEEHQIGISTTSLIDTYTQEFDEEKWAFVVWNKSIQSKSRDRVLFAIEAEYCSLKCGYADYLE